MIFYLYGQSPDASKCVRCEATEASMHPVWCLRKAQNELRLRRFTECVNNSETHDNKTDEIKNGKG